MRLSLPQNQKQSRLSRQEEINSTKSSKRMGTEKKSQMLGFPWVQPFLHWHPYLPSPPYSLHLIWPHRNLNWSKAAGDGLPFGFPPPLSSGPQTSRWRISYWGGRCEGESESGPTHFSSLELLILPNRTLHSLFAHSFLCLKVLPSPFCLLKLYPSLRPHLRPLFHKVFPKAPAKTVTCFLAST